MTGSATVLRANALALPLPDASVDLVVTSPPYFGLRSYQDGGEHYAGQLGSEPTPTEFVDALLAATREMVRVLKPSGSMWINLGDKYDSGTTTARTNPGTIKDGTGQGYYLGSPRVSLGRPKSLFGIPWRYALRCIDDLGLILRAEVIWSKPNGLPESVTDRVRRSHEQWFHFTREPRYYSAVDEIREPHIAASLRRIAAGFNPTKRDVVEAAHNGALPGSVWTVPSEPLIVPTKLGVDHFAAFPTQWPRRIMLGWSPPCSVVLDPFGGTGTTALVAKALGRHGISVDLSADYCRLAEWRTTDRGELAKAMRVPKPDPVPDDQLEMFA